MRIKIVLFLSLVFVQVSFGQSLLQQEIDFVAEGITISETLQKLSAETGFDIAFSSKFFDKNLRISQRFEKTKIESILSEILENTNVTFKTLGDRIILFLKKAPQLFTISGYVKDKKTGERLIAATIYCSQNKKGTVTNEYGFYSLTLPQGNTKMQVQFLGYQGTIQAVDLKQNLQFDIELETNLTLPEILITPEIQQASAAIFKAPNNTIQLNESFVEASPGLGGEEDFIRVAQLLPGVQGGVDGLGGAQVRGGDSGQNLMLMDGVPVYIPYHLLGVYSVYNSSTVNSAQLLKGSFSARYGGRLSSVFDVRIKEGNKENWQGEAAVNLVNAKVLIEGPIQKGKGSVLFAGRLAPSGFLLNPEFKRIYFQVAEEEADLTSKFYDYNIKANYAVSDKDHLYLSLFSGADSFLRFFSEEEEEEEIFNSDLDFNWANTIGMLRWNHLFNEKLFANASITYSEFSFSNAVFEEFEGENDILDFAFLENSFVNKDVGLKIDFDYIPNPKHTIRFGTALSRKRFTTSFIYLEEDDDEVEDIDDANLDVIQELTDEYLFESLDATVYVEDQINFGPKWYANIGFRGSSFFNGDTKYFNLEPRFLLRYHWTPKISLYTSASKMVQYLHLVTNAALRLPNDLWIVSDDNLLPSSSLQSEFGASWQANEKFNISLDVYYKKMKNLLAYPDDRDFLEDVDIENPESFLTKGSGIAYGAELFFKYNSEKNQFGLSYVLSKSERQYEEQNLGLSYAHEYDQRHQVKLFAYQKIGSHFLLGANWIYNSPNPQWGLAYTNLGVDSEPQNFSLPGQRNKIRSSAYQRLDLSLSYHYLGTKLEHRVKLGGYNLFNYQNTAFYNQYIDGIENIKEPVTGIPFMPSLSYSLNF